MSATYHIICNHSLNVNAFSQKLDHLGIIILTSGSFLSMIYYGWYCEPKLRYVSSTMVSRAPEFPECLRSGTFRAVYSATVYSAIRS
jgi:Haemolysin-III related